MSNANQKTRTISNVTVEPVPGTTPDDDFLEDESLKAPGEFEYHTNPEINRLYNAAGDVGSAAFKFLDQYLDGMASPSTSRGA